MPYSMDAYELRFAAALPAMSHTVLSNPTVDTDSRDRLHGFLTYNCSQQGPLLISCAVWTE